MMMKLLSYLDQQSEECIFCILRLGSHNLHVVHIILHIFHISVDIQQVHQNMLIYIFCISTFIAY
jgi:hypothetical protein